MTNTSHANPMASVKPQLFQPQAPRLEQTWLQYLDPEKLAPHERRLMQDPQFT